LGFIVSLLSIPTPGLQDLAIIMGFFLTIQAIDAGGTPFCSLEENIHDSLR